VGNLKEDMPTTKSASLVEFHDIYFGAREATIFSKRGSPRNGSQKGEKRRSPGITPDGGKHKPLDNGEIEQLCERINKIKTAVQAALELAASVEERQTWSLLVRGISRISRPTCSGSSIWTKCRAPGTRNSSAPSRNSWNFCATPFIQVRIGVAENDPDRTPELFQVGDLKCSKKYCRVEAIRAGDSASCRTNSRLHLGWS
jgi:hypothetical protein